MYKKNHFKIPEESDPDAIYDGCHCGDCHFTIHPNGDVMACRRIENIVGNLFRKPVDELWNGHEMDYYRQYDKFAKCSKCELIRFCSGCPTVAFGYHRSFFQLTHIASNRRNDVSDRKRSHSSRDS